MSKNTENYKLYTFTNDSDVADLKLLEPTFDTIDKGLVLDVGESTGSGNNYVLNLGSITLTSANKGISFKFWSDKNASGAVKINGTYNLVKANGSSVTNLKAGAPYTVTYDGGTNFFLASGGGADTVNFTSDKLLTGYSANDSNGEKINGTMPNKGAVTASLNCGGSYTIPAGYHNGSGKVTANSLSSQTSANATAKDIIKGKTAWVNGSKITGTATIQSSGGMQIKTDKITITKSTSSANLPITINNIGFKPKIVIMNFTNETGSDPTSGGVEGFAFVYDRNSSIVNILNNSNYNLLGTGYGYSCTGMGINSSKNKQGEISSATFGNGSFSTTIYYFYSSWSGSVECSYIAIG